MNDTVLVHVGGFSAGLVATLEGQMPDEAFATLDGDGELPKSDVLLTLDPSAEQLQRALDAGVQWVHVFGAGVDRVPLDLLTDRLVTCSRGAAAPAIAEFVLAALLAFEKRLPDPWISEPPEHWGMAGLGGLRGKTLGVIGLGAIGIEIARRALAFDMDVVAVRRTNAPSPLDGVSVTTSLHDLLGRSDHAVVAAPATADTRHLLDAAAFAAAKPGLHLVNIARGTLIDQDALLAALDTGRLGMASLDVVDPEPLPAGHALYTHPKVRLSPHISWSSPDTLQRMFERFVENLHRYRAGQPLEGIVDTRAGY
jgi:phosphoglycerate dehydrogenase-like enzyme